MRYLVLILIILICLSGVTVAQDAEPAKEKDNSKPTNVYSQVDNFLQFETHPDFNTFGYAPRLSYAPHEDHLFLLEVPLLYTTLTETFGLGDVRLRYFMVPYRDYTKFVGAMGAALDVFVPTGRFEDGLGSSSWRVSPGFTMGFIFNKAQTISAFPTLSYTYTSKPTTDLIPENLKEVDHGANLQILTSFVLNDDAFILFTPIYDVKDFTDVREDRFIFEVETVIDVMRDRFQVGTFYRGNVQDSIHTISVYFTVFL